MKIYHHPYGDHVEKQLPNSHGYFSGPKKKISYQKNNLESSNQPQERVIKDRKKKDVGKEKVLITSVYMSWSKTKNLPKTQEKGKTSLNHDREDEKRTGYL